jgi:hypothetical protein
MTFFQLIPYSYINPFTSKICLFFIKSISNDMLKALIITRISSQVRVKPHVKGHDTLRNFFFQGMNLTPFLFRFCNISVSVQQTVVKLNVLLNTRGNNSRRSHHNKQGEITLVGCHQILTCMNPSIVKENLNNSAKGPSS